jgi:putative aminopeptidase FrvX
MVFISYSQVTVLTFYQSVSADNTPVFPSLRLSMSFDICSNLMQVLSLDAIPGFESPVADVIEPQLARHAIRTRRDVLGNVIAQYGCQKPDALRVMVFAHMDEVGFMVRKIEANGFIRFERVGGPAQITMPGSTVNLQGSKGSVPGCIGIKSYHFSKGDVRTQPPSIDHLWISAVPPE